MDRAQPKLAPRYEPQDPAVLDAARAKIQLTCCYCHDVAERDAFAYCAGCLAPHHPDCFEEHGGCTVPGCGARDVVRPQRGVAARPQPAAVAARSDRAGWVRPLGGFVLGGLLCVGFVFLVGAALGVGISSRSEGGSAAPVPATVAVAAEEQRARLTLVGEDVPLAVLTRQIAAVAARPIALESSRSPRVSVELRDVTWTEALAVVVERAELDLEVAPDGRLVLSEPPMLSLEAGQELRDALHQLALHAGRNLTIGASVSGPLGEGIENVRWEVALEQIARAHGLQVSARGEVLHVGKAQVPGAQPLRAQDPRARLEALEEQRHPARVSLTGEFSVEGALRELQGVTPYALVLEEGPVDTGGAGVILEDAYQDTVDLDGEETEGFATANGEAVDRVQLSVQGATWEAALTELCRVASLSQDRCGEQIFLRPLERNALRARHTELRAWLQALAHAADAPLELGDGVQGVAAIDLDGVSYRAALVASAEAYGLNVEPLADGGYRLTRPAESAVPTGPERTLQGTELGGVTYRASAVVVSDVVRLAVINGRVYGEGDALPPAEDGAKAWVGEIRDDLVLVEAVDEAGEETYSCLVLDY